MNRIELLNKLINYEDSVDVLNTELAKFGWDSSYDLIFLYRKNILHILNLYLQGKINELDVEKWANSIESREDVGQEEGYKDLINEMIYELANPYLTERLTRERANILSAKLK